MKTLKNIIVVVVAVIFTSTAYARSSVPEEALDYALSNKSVGQTYVSHNKGKRISITVMADKSSPSMICKLYSYSIEKQTKGEYVVEQSAEGEACKFGYDWVTLGSKEHEKVITAMQKAQNPCKTQSQEKSDGKVQRVARKEFQNLSKGKRFNATALAGEMFVSAFFTDRRESTKCTY